MLGRDKLGISQLQFLWTPISVIEHGINDPCQNVGRWTWIQWILGSHDNEFASDGEQMPTMWGPQDS